MKPSTRPPPPSPAKPWLDRWLADAAIRRGVHGAERLKEFAGRATAWEALAAGGATNEAVLELACLVSATKPADLSHVGPADAALMTQAISEKHDVVAVRADGTTIVVATSNPLATTLERDLNHAMGKRIEIVTAGPHDIVAARQRIYVDAGPGRATPAAVSPVADEADGVRANISHLVDQIFVDALRQDASDIHFEPKGDGLLVRFRVDGGLYDARRVPLDQSPQVIRRLKVLANVDIADSIRPQDGRATITHEGRGIDLRVSTLPLGGAGEKVVVRILDSRVAARELDVIGFTKKELARVRRLLELPEGLILVTGPTGSGKTSTLYAAVRHVHRSDLNIVTVEDPIEYRIDGINQVQVNERTRMTFAASLRSILRQDPDVVLVGEMRDAETASIAVKASMTGHLVLSTLHASDALSTLDRLYGMDIDTGALAAALKGIVGQRLVRKLCEHCAMPIALADLPTRQQLLLVGRKTDKLRTPVGCAECRGTGYRGRTIVAEVFLVTPSIQRAIARRADLGELSDLARQCGTLTMWESGLERVFEGATSLYELLDNVAAPIAEEEEAGSAQADIDALLAQLLAKPTDHPAPIRPALPAFHDVPIPADIAFDDAFDLAMEGSAGEAAAGGPPSRGAASRNATGGAGRTGPLRVLLADDDRVQRRVVAEAMGQAGFSVLEAADGEAALNYARRLHPDIIVTDVALPRLDAMGLLQGLSAEGIRARVLVYTTQADPDLCQWLLELGAEDIVPRTVQPQALAARLRGKVISLA